MTSLSQPSGGSFGSLTGAPGDNAALAAALALKLDKAGGTMTGQLVLTPGANIVGNTVNGTVTGAGVTRTLMEINDDWTGASGGTSAPTVLKLAITDSGGLNYGATTAFNILRNGSSVFRIDHGGTVSGAGGGYFLDTNNLKIQMATTWRLTWNEDVSLYRDAASFLALRVGTTAQGMRVYGTYTDASNYRRLALGSTTAGVFSIAPEGAGTGASGNVLHISGLPTSNPGPGILWNNAGTPAIGT